MNRRLFLYAGVAVAAAAGGYAYRTRQGGAADAPTNTGTAAESAPSAAASADPVADLRALSLPDLDGATHRLDQWSGRPMVVNFWATWCAPCVKEMPELQALHEKYPGIQFVGIGVDKAGNMRKFLKKVAVTYPLLVLEDGAIDRLRALGNPAGGLPFTLVFDENGDIHRKILGQIQADDLDNTLSALVA